MFATTTANGLPLCELVQFLQADLCKKVKRVKMTLFNQCQKSNRVQNVKRPKVGLFTV